MTNTVETLERLRAIWEDVLETAIADPDADFFEIGGDSLSALMVANQAIRAGMAMPRAAVMLRPTLRTLAEAVADPSLFDAG